MPDSVADQGGRLIGGKRLQKPQGPVDRMKNEGMRRMVEQEENVSQQRAAGRGQQAAQGEEGAAYLKPTCSFIDFNFSIKGTRPTRTL